jgi:hypothetical protein
MEFNKWLKRKYPKNHEKIKKVFGEYGDLENMFKVQKYRPAIWIGEHHSFSDVKKGDLIFAHCTKEYSWSEWNGLYEQDCTSNTWLGSYDCRYYTEHNPHEQNRVCNKFWEYIKL